ncbi:hypothetical protein INR49_003422, partial [Caranx melampygus]
MEGDEFDERRGVIPRAVQQIFKAAEKLGSQGWRWRNNPVSVSTSVHLHGELCGNLQRDPADLLYTGKASKRPENDPQSTNTRLPLPTSRPRLIALANQNRSTAQTAQNAVRQPLCAWSILPQRADGEESSQGERFKEMTAINGSLSNLGIVISALATRSYIPYRNSKLTYLLRMSRGNSKTLMFVNIAPETDSFGETLNFPEIASKVNDCVIGTASANRSLARLSGAVKGDASLSAAAAELELELLLDGKNIGKMVLKLQEADKRARLAAFGSARDRTLLNGCPCRLFRRGGQQQQQQLSSRRHTWLHGAGVLPQRSGLVLDSLTGSGRTAGSATSPSTSRDKCSRPTAASWPRPRRTSTTSVFKLTCGPDQSSPPAVLLKNMSTVSIPAVMDPLAFESVLSCAYTGRSGCCATTSSGPSSPSAPPAPEPPSVSGASPSSTNYFSPPDGSSFGGAARLQPGRQWTEAEPVTPPATARHQEGRRPFLIEEDEEDVEEEEEEVLYPPRKRGRGGGSGRRKKTISVSEQEVGVSASFGVSSYQLSSEDGDDSALPPQKRPTYSQPASCPANSGWCENRAHGGRRPHRGVGEEGGEDEDDEDEREAELARERERSDFNISNVRSLSAELSSRAENDMDSQMDYCQSSEDYLKFEGGLMDQTLAQHLHDNAAGQARARTERCRRCWA